ncbi:MAG TPA: transcriptional repressor [Candidatus Saccharimonadales bacterium]|nr:transcriptional repressor [Candidatus Saccharimonadales bacterium]
MYNARALLKDTLRSHGLSLTEARLSVFKILLGYGPLNMVSLLNKTSGRADRASVYRAAATFEKIGIAQRVSVGMDEKLELTEIFEGHHHHFSCTNCGRIISINDRQLESYIDNLPSLRGNQIVAHQLDIQGLCSKCLSISQT